MDGHEVVMFTFKHLDLTMQTGYTSADGISSIERKVLMLCIVCAVIPLNRKERTRLPVYTRSNSHTHVCW